MSLDVARYRSQQKAIDYVQIALPVAWRQVLRDYR